MMARNSMRSSSRVRFDTRLPECTPVGQITAGQADCGCGGGLNNLPNKA